MEKEIECPYCETMNEEPDECYEEGVLYETECENSDCSKTFGFYISYLKCYSGECKLPCRNGEEHKWIQDKNWPKSWGNRYKCEYCETEKVTRHEL